MRYAPRRKIKKAREIEGAGNDYHLHIQFMIGEDDVLDVDDLSKPNETVHDRCAMMARAGLLYNYYEDKKEKRKKDMLLVPINNEYFSRGFMLIPYEARWDFSDAELIPKETVDEIF